MRNPIQKVMALILAVVMPLCRLRTAPTVMFP